MTPLGVVGAVLVVLVLTLGVVVIVFDRRRIRRVSARLTLTIDRDEPRSHPLQHEQTGHAMADNENSPLPSKAPEPRSPGPDPEPGTGEPTPTPEEPGGPSTPEHEGDDVSPRVVPGVVTVTESVEYDAPAVVEVRPAPPPEPEPEGETDG